MPMARLILSVSLRGIDVVSHGSSVFGARIANGGTDLPSASQPGISYSDSLFAQLAKSDAPAVPREYLAEVRRRAYLVVSLRLRRVGLAVLELALRCGVVLGNRYQDLLANASAARCQRDRVVRYLFKSIPKSSK